MLSKRKYNCHSVRHLDRVVHLRRGLPNQKSYDHRVVTYSYENETVVNLESSGTMYLVIAAAHFESCFSTDSCMKEASRQDCVRPANLLKTVADAVGG